MVLVDQHAAHERILFEKLKRGPAGELGRPAGQRLLMPEVISLPPRDLAFVKQSLPILEEAGVELEPFGGDAVVVRSIPAFLSGTEARTLVADLIEECMEGDPGMPLTERRERIFTALACRGAVKANRRTRTVKLRGRARKITFHVFDPRQVEALLEGEHPQPGAPCDQEELVRSEQEGRTARFTIGLVAARKGLVHQATAGTQQCREQCQARTVEEVGDDDHLEPLGREAPPSGFQVFRANLIGQPTEIVGEMTWTLGLQASPGKPLPVLRPKPIRATKSW